MNLTLCIILRIGILAANMAVADISDTTHDMQEIQFSERTHDTLKVAAFEILTTKCNVCHKKQNPFKVFSLKNMNKHAPKIYKQVFIQRRMPKGDNIKLTETEYETLAEWLLTQNIK